mmetsp:Transcript_13949/g.35636  ORF Transcript_13949/g.35636 Transcript_13949/m.35636 type:complete len:196 (-) Transcript_13949:175-762(-)
MGLFDFFEACCGSDDVDLAPEEPQPCTLDPRYKGNEVVLSSDNLTVSGTGTALALAPLLQDRSFFEFTVQTPGSFAVGVASREVDRKGALGNDAYSWAFRSDLFLVHNKATEQIISDTQVCVGDVIGVSYDHTVLSFYHNGVLLDSCFYSVRGRVYPAISVDGAQVSANFGHLPFVHPLAKERGFKGVLFEQSII